ncbi:MAG: hypothetical protein RSE41_08150, partial [Clostridia bacterium]
QEEKQQKIIELLKSNYYVTVEVKGAHNSKNPQCSGQHWVAIDKTNTLNSSKSSDFDNYTIYMWDPASNEKKLYKSKYKAGLCGSSINYYKKEE